MDRDAHDPVRPRRPVPAGDDVSGHGAGRHEERDRRRARREVEVHVRDARAEARRRAIRPVRAAAARRADVRDVRSADRSGRRCSRSCTSPRTARRSWLNGSKAPALPVARCRRAARIAKDKQLAATSRRRRRTSRTAAGSRSARRAPLPKDAAINVEIGAGTPSRRGPEPAPPSAQAFDVPHVSAAAHRPGRVRLGRRVPARHAVRDHVRQPARRGQRGTTASSRSRRRSPTPRSSRAATASRQRR